MTGCFACASGWQGGRGAFGGSAIGVAGFVDPVEVGRQSRVAPLGQRQRRMPVGQRHRRDAYARMGHLAKHSTEFGQIFAVSNREVTTWHQVFRRPKTLCSVNKMLTRCGQPERGACAFGGQVQFLNQRARTWVARLVPVVAMFLAGSAYPLSGYASGPTVQE